VRVELPKNWKPQTDLDRFDKTFWPQIHYSLARLHLTAMKQ
jgi:hypothetical protein